jgi:hypothetical protein
LSVSGDRRRRARWWSWRVDRRLSSAKNAFFASPEDVGERHLNGTPGGTRVSAASRVLVDARRELRSRATESG